MLGNLRRRMTASKNFDDFMRIEEKKRFRWLVRVGANWC
jgi:hypothetical protein